MKKESRRRPAPHRPQNESEEDRPVGSSPPLTRVGDLPLPETGTESTLRTYLQRKETLAAWMQDTYRHQQEWNSLTHRMHTIGRWIQQAEHAIAVEWGQRREKKRLWRELQEEKSRRQRLLKLLCQSEQCGARYQVERWRRLEAEVDHSSAEGFACIFTNRLESSFARGELKARLRLRKEIDALEQEAEGKKLAIMRVRLERRRERTPRQTGGSGGPFSSYRSGFFAASSSFSRRPPQSRHRGRSSQPAGKTTANGSVSSSTVDSSSGGGGRRYSRTPRYTAGDRRGTREGSSGPTTPHRLSSSHAADNHAANDVLWYYTEALRRSGIREWELDQEITSLQASIQMKQEQVEELSEKLYHRRQREARGSPVRENGAPHPHRSPLHPSERHGVEARLHTHDDDTWAMREKQKHGHKGALPPSAGVNSPHTFHALPSYEEKTDGAASPQMPFSDPHASIPFPTAPKPPPHTVDHARVHFRRPPAPAGRRPSNTLVSTSWEEGQQKGKPPRHEYMAATLGVPDSPDADDTHGDAGVSPSGGARGKVVGFAVSPSKNVAPFDAENERGNTFLTEV